MPEVALCTSGLMSLDKRGPAQSAVYIWLPPVSRLETQRRRGPILYGWVTAAFADSNFASLPTAYSLRWTTDGERSTIPH